MSESGYGQQDAMEDASMVATLQAQIDMIWPLEEPILERIGLGDAESLVDFGCGTGRFLYEVAHRWPMLACRGIERFEGHMGIAERDLADCPNVSLTLADARTTGLPDDSAGAVSMRHILQAVESRDELINEATRILRPGGLLYVLAEDYQGIIVDTDREQGRTLFMDAAPKIRHTGTHLFHGREAFRDLHRAGYEDVRVDSIVVDSTTTSRILFARMLRAWRDGYASFLAKHRGVSEDEQRANFDSLIESCESPDRYIGWWLFAVSGRKPAAA